MRECFGICFPNESIPWLQVHINLGAGESEVSSPRGLRLDDLAWHDVRIERENADLQLTIDGIYKNR